MKKRNIAKFLRMLRKEGGEISSFSSSSLISEHPVVSSSSSANMNSLCKKSIVKIQKRLKYKFNDRIWLEQALTRRSFVLESISTQVDEQANQRLEFIGDRVLELAVARILFVKNSGDNEGELNTKLKYCVNNTTLATIATRLRLGKYLIVGKGEEMCGIRENQKVLADTLEAIIGAIYFDSNEDMKRVCKFVARHFKTYLKQILASN
ncbi:hypothetical protein FDP41_004215 [Naegleria fowleri]|uniref:ribonuclease III n=1 Tax=Naegleria fowleri TaxID=5763 RepID=A0A6A5BT03_NAEFO|nr:uncharacterized protein FDP41_004215 [Naegleria fowleri]KAF0976920.1 hypothetical protein FDP41_004215 [Naegleria fowleri]CAG4711095.1 unnamed protein product [Naegleria fowleri]